MLGLSLKLLSWDEDYYGEHLAVLNNRWNDNNKSQKYWMFSKHCTDILIPQPLPDPTLLTDDLKYYWHKFSSRLKYNKLEQNNLINSLMSTLMKAVYQKKIIVEHILLSERLININRYDLLSRKRVIELLTNFLRKQTHLKIVSLEGLRLTKSEGSKILSALSSSSKSITFLYLWQAFEHHKSVLANQCHGMECKSQIQNDSYWLQDIKRFKFLHSISLNYHYIASESGDILINLARQLKQNWLYLQLLLLEDVENTSIIPDFAWEKVKKFSQNLNVQIVVLGIPEYDLHKRIFTKNLPLHTLFLSTDHKILFNYDPYMLDCTFKTILRNYNQCLVQLHLNCYNHREQLDNHLRKIIPTVSNLKIFEFVGKVMELVTIITMCCQIKHCYSAIKVVNMQLQSLDPGEGDDWLSKIPNLLHSFSCEFESLGVTFDISRYPF